MLNFTRLLSGACFSLFLTSGCGGTLSKSTQSIIESGRRHEYVLDLERANKLFAFDSAAPSSDAQRTVDADKFPQRVASPEELFSLQVEWAPGRTYTVPTHLFGSKVRLIPYADRTEVNDAAGVAHRGDEVVAHYFPPGDIGFCIKHHRPKHRQLRLTKVSDVAFSKDDIKLQDTHIGIVVGVEAQGQAGVITLNQPQNYQNGGFGDDFEAGDYPMIFIRPRFPAEIPPKEKRLFIDNIRTMAVALNSVAVFPDDYDGGDPLSAKSPEEIGQIVKNIIKATAGDASAVAYFKSPANHLYCAEFAFVATTAGLLFPLNRKVVTELGVTEGEWAGFVQQVELHNQQDPNRSSFFRRWNSNQKVAPVRLANLPDLEALRPIGTYLRSGSSAASKLAFEPITAADILEGFIRLVLPRERLGEEFAEPQALALRMMKPGLLEMMSIRPGTPDAKAADLLYERIISVVERKYPNYAAFQSALYPLMQEARKLTGGRNGERLFTPPSLFHLVLLGLHAKQGLIGLDYVGHGVHFSIVKARQ